MSKIAALSMLYSALTHAVAGPYLLGIIILILGVLVLKPILATLGLIMVVVAVLVSVYVLIRG